MTCIFITEQESVNAMRSILRRAGMAVAGTALLAMPVAAQDAAAGSGFDPAVRVGVGFVTTLIAGVMLVSNMEGYASRVAGTVRGRPLVSFITGMVVYAGFFVVVFLCSLLGPIGQLLIVPVALTVALVALLGNAVAYLAVLAPVVGRLPSVLLAAVVAGVAAYLPAVGTTAGLVGGAVVSILGTVGLGAMALVFY